MKKLLFLIILLFPIITFAGTREVDMWSDFDALIQPEAKQEIWQDGMYAKYEANPKTLTDKITYKVNGKSWTTKGPWSLASEKMRQKVRNCIKSESGFTAASCGWFDYNIIRLSPSGNYIELHGGGYEHEIWRMLDTKTAKIIFSTDNHVVKSMWTRDRKQFIWKTECGMGECDNMQGTFITELGKFPKYKKVQ